MLTRLGRRRVGLGKWCSLLGGARRGGRGRGRLLRGGRPFLGVAGGGVGSEKDGDE